MKKKVLAVLLGGCMVAGLLAGCGGGGDDAKTSDDGSKDSGKSGGYNFEVVVKSFQSTYWQAAKQGIDTAAKELNVKCNTTGPNAARRCTGFKPSLTSGSARCAITLMA